MQTNLDPPKQLLLKSLFVVPFTLITEITLDQMRVIYYLVDTNQLKQR